MVGSKDDVAAFVVTARGARPTTGDKPDSLNGPYRMVLEPLCFHMFAPLPDEFSVHPYGDRRSVGYNLEMDGWGVKWGAYDWEDDMPRITEDGAAATYEFTCAWGPPVKALKRASLRYPVLKFYLSWGEEGPCRGRHEFARGEVTHERRDDYKIDIAPEMPSDDDYERDEDAASKKADDAERKYIASHDAWVASSLAAHSP